MPANVTDLKKCLCDAADERRAIPKLEGSEHGEPGLDWKNFPPVYGDYLWQEKCELASNARP